MLLILAWIALAALHLMPALVTFKPGLVKTLYGIDADNPLAILIIHRGALFLAVLVACLYAAFFPDARRVATLVAGISVVSFLLLYTSAGMPKGGLAKIARADLIGLPALVFVAVDAFFTSPS